MLSHFNLLDVVPAINFAPAGEDTSVGNASGPLSIQYPESPESDSGSVSIASNSVNFQETTSGSISPQSGGSESENLRYPRYHRIGWKEFVGDETESSGSIDEKSLPIKGSSNQSLSGAFNNESEPDGSAKSTGTVESKLTAVAVSTAEVGLPEDTSIEVKLH
jgi:hypothetical protein